MDNISNSLSADNLPHTSDVQAPSPLRKLQAFDWDFPKRIAHSEIEGIHPYPAKFIAELPRALLSALPLPTNTAVLDPYCGSGSTLVESQKRGVQSIGIDLNPIACLISRVKTSPAPDRLLQYAQEAIVTAKNIQNPSIPSIPNLGHWFETKIQQSLSRLVSAIADTPSTTHDCLNLALSSIIVRVSNQESDTRYAAIKKDIDPESVYSLFLRAVERISEVLHARAYPLAPARVIEGDTLAVTEAQIPETIGLTITSPPYPNAYEYWLYHKYRMWWLGYDPIHVRTHEIGARAHFFKKNHHTADDFVRQMNKTFSLLESLTAPGGYACFVVGRSRIHGRTVDNAAIIEEAGRAAGFSKYYSAERTLSANRKSFNLSHANIKTETVLVLKKKSH